MSFIPIGRAIVSNARFALAFSTGIKSHYWMNAYTTNSILLERLDNLVHVASGMPTCTWSESGKNWKIFEEGILSRTGTATIGQIFNKNAFPQEIYVHHLCNLGVKELISHEKYPLEEFGRVALVIIGAYALITNAARLNFISAVCEILFSIWICTN